MTSSSRVLAILGLFSREHAIWTTDEINEVLGYTRATGYRYVKDLVDVGLLRKVSTGQYALGGRIIELDYQLRQSDPVLLAAIPAMEKLSAKSGFDAVLSVLFEGPRVIDIHRVSVQGRLELAYGRGRPRPLFQSGSPKILLSALPRAQLLKLHHAHAEEIRRHGMGDSWKAFWSYLAQVRQQGFYRAAGELEKGLGAAAVPVLGADQEQVAALALVGTGKAIMAAPEEQLKTWLHEATRKIQRQLQARLNAATKPENEPGTAAPRRHISGRSAPLARP